ncbi:hypothetical protein FH609_004125 [Streptomyces sp. 3MP-14]|uniref:Uncharacterized protein n=1 Tax=Streptomyces mimosae TaxID=2586635 RepID=A0A5N6A3U9_9ACTN|nr:MULTISPECIES: hypothetical protein [Streptomyces]KAB8162922.1 hypothetical protein FH607_019990 [Streptomyces mimosae]KAB8179135.1 hypothetical protein FH609_004125 [Streptomyces sp. 3MP-14]
MSFVLLDARLFTGGADLSGHSNKIELSGETEDKDVTNYRSDGWTEVLGGLASAEISGAGQWEAGDPGMVDDVSWSMLGGIGAWTVCPTDSTPGALAYFTRALRADYTLGESVGEVAPWSGTAKSSWPLVRGVIEHPPGIARTADGSSAGVELGPVPAGGRLYAVLHVLSAAGTTPSLTVTVESSGDDEFEEPATVLTLDAATEPGGQVVRTAGDAVTDGWFRVSWEITGTSPSFLFVVALGIA